MKLAILLGLLTILVLPSRAHHLYDDLNYATCQTAVQNGSMGLIGLVDQNGTQVTNLSQVDGILYRQCILYCGDGWQPNDTRIPGRL